MKNRLFDKVAALCLVMMAALMLTGISYGAWSQELTVSTLSHTGTLVWALARDNPYTQPASGTITASVSGGSLTISITPDAAARTYYVPFNLACSGTTPVKVQGAALSALPPGVTVLVKDDLNLDVKGLQADPGTTKTGLVTINNISPSSNPFSFTIVFTIVQWNLFLP